MFYHEFMRLRTGIGFLMLIRFTGGLISWNREEGEPITPFELTITGTRCKDESSGY